MPDATRRTATTSPNRMREMDVRGDLTAPISATLLIPVCPARMSSRTLIVFHFCAAGPGLALKMNFIFKMADGILTSVSSAMLQKRIDDQPSISREMVREAQEILHRHLKRVGLKQTAQRDTILRLFLETRDHLSTDELHRLVQKKDAGIGYTTVYRTLKLLSECGLASEVAFHDGIARS